jgi:hypothetical protein
VKVLRYGPGKSSTPHAIPARHAAGWRSIHVVEPAAVRPGITSRSWDGELTSTIEVHQCWVRHRPVRANSVSSKPSAVTGPIRAGSSISGVP